MGIRPTELPPGLQRNGEILHRVERKSDAHGYDKKERDEQDEEEKRSASDDGTFQDLVEIGCSSETKETETDDSVSESTEDLPKPAERHLDIKV